jgi:hypothetical protein
MAVITKITAFWNVTCVYIFALVVVYLTMLSLARLYSIKWIENNELKFGMDLEGSGHSPIEAIS